MAKLARLQCLIVSSRRDQQESLPALKHRGICPEMDCRFSLEQLTQAFRVQESAANFGKMVVEW